MDINQLLRESVFYPCSGLDSAPTVFLLRKGFTSFVYADYSITKESFRDICRKSWFFGYTAKRIKFLKTDTIFGESWNTIRLQNHNLFENLYYEWSEPFIAIVNFERAACMKKDFGPDKFTLMFVRCEAITTFLSLYTKRDIAPKCLAYIRSGIGFGGNYKEFPLLLDQSIRNNPGGYPEFMLYDRLATGGSGDNMPLVNEYWPPLDEWDYNTDNNELRHLTFAKHMGANGVPRDPYSDLSPVRPTVD